MITVYTRQPMPRRDPQVDELRRLLRLVLRGVWRRRRPPADLVHRREALEDRRRTMVYLNGQSSTEVEAWLGQRDEALRTTLAALGADERSAFLKGLRILADELMRESPHGPVGSHHRAARGRRADRDRSV